MRNAFGRRLRRDRFTPAELAAMAWNPSYRAPSALDFHDDTLAQPPRPGDPLEDWGARDLQLEQGIAVGCSLSGRAFLTLGEAILAPPWEGVAAVRLVAVRPFLRELAACPHLARITRLDLSGNRMGDSGAMLLASSPHLGNLRELILSGNDLGPEAMAAIGVAPWFDRLDTLEVSENAPGAFRLPTRLRRLAVARCGIVDASPFERVEDLDIRHNALGPDGLPSRVRTRMNAAFAELEDAGVEAFAEAEHPRLESLNCAANRLTADAAAALAASRGFPALRELNLSINPLGDDGAVALLAGDGLASVTQLDLSNCALTDRGIERLAASGTLGGLTHLSLAWNAVGPDAIRRLTASPHLAGLRELNLTGTRYNDPRF